MPCGSQSSGQTSNSFGPSSQIPSSREKDNVLKKNPGRQRPTMFRFLSEEKEGHSDVTSPPLPVCRRLVGTLHLESGDRLASFSRSAGEQVG